MSALATVIAYHQRTKHHFHRYAASLGYMDWANQPNPFRRYEGAIVTQLKFNSEQTRFPYERLYEPNPVPPALVNLGTLSDFFYYSLGLSAWKATGPNRWALRVNPSSGNLHPTEAYVLVKSLGGEQDMPPVSARTSPLAMVKASPTSVTSSPPTLHLSRSDPSNNVRQPVALIVFSFLPNIVLTSCFPNQHCAAVRGKTAKKRMK